MMVARGGQARGRREALRHQLDPEATYASTRCDRTRFGLANAGVMAAAASVGPAALSSHVLVGPSEPRADALATDTAQRWREPIGERGSDVFDGLALRCVIRTVPGRAIVCRAIVCYTRAMPLPFDL